MIFILMAYSFLAKFSFVSSGSCNGGESWKESVGVQVSSRRRREHWHLGHIWMWSKSKPFKPPVSTGVCFQLMLFLDESTEILVIKKTLSATSRNKSFLTD